MKQLSRRKVLGTAAASVVAGVGLAKGGAQAFADAGSARTAGSPAGEGSRVAVRTMTLEEFRALEASEVDHVLSKMDCTNFSCCHEKVREEMGIWIPELVPVFEKLDALRAGAGA